MQKIENVKYWRDSELTGLETSLVKDSGHVFPNHSHESVYAIGLMFEGGSYCLGPQREDAFVAPGEIALINPGQVHSGVPASGAKATYRMIYVDVDLMREAAKEMFESDGRLPIFEKTVVHHPELYFSLWRICQLIPSKTDLMEKESSVIDSLVPLISNFGGLKEISLKPANNRRIITQTKELLSSDLERKISLEEAARAVSLSRYHFLRVFKKETGLPPHVFRTQQRVEASKRLLRRKIPFAQVALETGFADQSHFVNKFRQFIGATPTQYLSVYAG
ncbi:MAG: AraC family transcriptional regulator [Deltaproteobacteria bacterium]|nr:AraC family transcriptional regulator [Deltaproteobacteria bacterium]